ncbi:hypothetical protein [Tropicibacter naphthalenivorans]|nr:hypothetical protein [Tropicibacter naphthalenivorans]
MNTPIFAMTPDFSPVVKLMAMQTRFAMETSQGMIKLAFLPWQGMQLGFGGIGAPTEPAAKPAPAAKAKVAEKPAAKAAPKAAPKPKLVEPVAKEAPKPAAKPAAKAEAPKPAPKAEVKAAPAISAPKAGSAPKAETPKPAPKPEVKAEAPKSAPKAETAKPAPKAETPKPAPKAEAPKGPAKPATLASAPAKADDLTALEGVGPKLAKALNEAGIYQFSQVAAWSEANVAWIDDNIAGVRGRASRNGWVAQAAKLAK